MEALKGREDDDLKNDLKIQKLYKEQKLNNLKIQNEL